MSISRPMLALASATVLAAASVAAAPTSGTVDVTVEGDTVTVAGTLAEELATITVGTDAPDDAVGSGAGVDISELRIGFPEVGKVAVSIALGDANPATGHAPTSVQYKIGPTIGSDTLELIADADPVSGGLSYGSQTCEAGTGTSECTSSPVEGSFEDGVITWVVPTAALPGSEVNAGSAEVNPQLGNTNAATLTATGGLLDTAGTNVAIPTIPGATLLIDGEATDEVRLGNGGYELTASGLAPGEHTLAVELCGGLECTTVELDPITVADGDSATGGA